MVQKPSLKRSLSLPVITLYGLGTTIGAGIFALIGKVAGRADMFTPVAFVAASLLAAFTAFSFAELSSRFPRAAGVAAYVSEGMRARTLSLAVGLLVAVSGVVSAAAILNGAVGYLQVFVAVPGPVAIVGLALILGGLAAWGISESAGTAAAFTLVEIAGLLLVIWAGRGELADLPARAFELAPPMTAGAWTGVLTGAFLAFYAYLGFEDMVVVAEEVKAVERNLPIAIVLTLVITALLYAGVGLVAVLSLPPDALAASGAPLSDIYARGTGGDPALITAISIFAVLNGALIQVIMAARMFYGLGAERQIPPVFARVHPATRTPVFATGVVTAGVLGLALGFPIEPLAEATSVLMLVVFMLANLALILVKRRRPRPLGATVFPAFVPVLGFAVSAAFLAFEAAHRWLG